MCVRARGAAAAHGAVLGAVQHEVAEEAALLERHLVLVVLRHELERGQEHRRDLRRAYTECLRRNNVLYKSFDTKQCFIQKF